MTETGPDLGRPVVDRVHTSRHQNMKELRAAKGDALRVLFMLDPRRQVILLLGGDKSGGVDLVVRVGSPRRPVRRLSGRAA